MQAEEETHYYTAEQLFSFLFFCGIPSELPEPVTPEFDETESLTDEEVHKIVRMIDFQLEDQVQK